MSCPQCGAVLIGADCAACGFRGGFGRAVVGTELPTLAITVGSTSLTAAPGTTVTIGRAPANTIVVTDSLVSSFHLSIRWADGWRLSDTGSTNGTWLAGERVTDVPVTDTQRVLLGGPDSPVVVDLRAQVPAIASTPGGVGAPVSPAPDATVAASALAASERARPPSAPYAVASSITLGRDSECTITLSDPLASRMHVQIIATPQGFTAVDLGSLNGTYVNGYRITECPVTDGDVLTVGNSDFVLQGGWPVPLAQHSAESLALIAAGLGFTLPEGKTLLADVNLVAAPGTLTAIIGPSGAGKSTFVNQVAGLTSPTVGQVRLGGLDVHRSYEAVRTRIGLVPQDDVVHRELTVAQALGYAARLRLPPDTAKDERDRVVDRVCAEMGLTEHLRTRVSRLSGGQRKRVSVAIELITEPAVLILDEPTSGLDPALDRQVMYLLRRLADAGRIVLVVTHSLSYLDVCDQILLLAPGGLPAYIGPPGPGVNSAFGTGDWAEIFAWTAAQPQAAYNNWLARTPRNTLPQLTVTTDTGGPSQVRRLTAREWLTQFTTVSKRQFRLIVADRGYSIFLALLPFVLGVLSLIVPGSAGFGSPSPDDPTEAQQLLVLLVLGACFMGLAMTARDLVGERPIFLRERAVGLSSTAYVGAKAWTFGVFIVLQTAVMVTITVWGKSGSDAGVLIGNGTAELFIGVTATALASAMVGLVLSAFVKSNEQVMPLLVIVIMAQLVMCGGMISVTGRAGLEQLSFLFTGRWGFAMAASTVGFGDITYAGTNVPVYESLRDPLWNHDAGVWLLALGALTAIAIVSLLSATMRLRLTKAR